MSSLPHDIVKVLPGQAPKLVITRQPSAHFFNATKQQKDGHIRDWLQCEVLIAGVEHPVPDIALNVYALEPDNGSLRRSTMLVLPDTPMAEMGVLASHGGSTVKFKVKACSPLSGLGASGTCFEVDIKYKDTVKFVCADGSFVQVEPARTHTVVLRSKPSTHKASIQQHLLPLTAVVPNVLDMQALLATMTQAATIVMAGLGEISRMNIMLPQASTSVNSPVDKSGIHIQENARNVQVPPPPEHMSPIVVFASDQKDNNLVVPTAKKKPDSFKQPTAEKKKTESITQPTSEKKQSTGSVKKPSSKKQKTVTIKENTVNKVDATGKGSDTGAKKIASKTTSTATYVDHDPKKVVKKGDKRKAEDNSRSSSSSDDSSSSDEDDDMDDDMDDASHGQSISSSNKHQTLSNKKSNKNTVSTESAVKLPVVKKAKRKTFCL